MDIPAGGHPVQLYHRLRWTEAVPEHVGVSGCLAWAVPAGDRLDTAVDLVVVVGVTQLATARLVIRSARTTEPFGHGTLPPCPRVTAGDRVADIAFSEQEILDFSERLGSRLSHPR
jgi:hypothetical protein